MTRAAARRVEAARQELQAGAQMARRGRGSRKLVQEWQQDESDCSNCRNFSKLISITMPISDFGDVIGAMLLSGSPASEEQKWAYE